MGKLTESQERAMSSVGELGVGLQIDAVKGVVLATVHDVGAGDYDPPKGEAIILVATDGSFDEVYERVRANTSHGVLVVVACRRPTRLDRWRARYRWWVWRRNIARVRKDIKRKIRALE